MPEPTNRPGGDGWIWVMDLIDILIDNQPTVPACRESICSPSVDTVLNSGDPSSLDIQNQTLMTTFLPSDWRMKFTSTDPLQLDFSPTTQQESITATPNSVGPPMFLYRASVSGNITYNVSGHCNNPFTVNSQVIDGNGSTVCNCVTGPITIHCSPIPLAWYQTGGADIIAVDSTHGNITSHIPGANMFFNSEKVGIPFLGTNSEINFNPGTVSVNLNSSTTPNWNVKNSLSGYKTAKGEYYNYDFFWNKFHPTIIYSETEFNNTTINTPGNCEGYEGYLICYKNGDLLVTGVNMSHIAGSQKVVVYVDGDLTINNKVIVEDGVDFIMFIVKGDINISPEVGDGTYVSAGTPSSADLEGIYLSNQRFITNANAALLSNQLYVRGLVISYYNGPDTTGIRFQRDLAAANSNFPSEIFEFAVDQYLLFPPFFSEKSITWKEVSP